MPDFPLAAAALADMAALLAHQGDPLGVGFMLGLKFNPNHDEHSGEFTSSEGISAAESIAADLPVLNPYTEGHWAVRFTNDWKADKKRGFSYAEWGVSPYESKEAATNDYPNNEIVHDRRLGGWLPRLEGLSSFADTTASEAMSKAKRWAGGGNSEGYSHIVIFQAKHVGTGTDNEDLTVPKADGKEYVVPLKGKSKPKRATKSLTDEAGAFGAELETLVRRAYRGRIGAAVFGNQMDDLLRQYIRSAYLEGLAEGAIEESEMDDADEAFIREMIRDQRTYVDNFAAAVMDAKSESDLRDQIANRVTMWSKTIRAAAMAGINSAKANQVVIFAGSNGKEDCPTCHRLLGERHRRKWFVDKGLVPGIPGNIKDGERGFECGGYNCEHTLEPVGAPLRVRGNA